MKIIKKYGLLLLLAMQCSGLYGLTNARHNLQVSSLGGSHQAGSQQKVQQQVVRKKQSLLSRIRVPLIIQQIVYGVTANAVNTLGMMATQYVVKKGATSALSCVGLSKKESLPGGQSPEFYINAAEGMLSQPTNMQICLGVAKNVFQSTLLSVVSGVLFSRIQGAVLGQ